MRVRTMADLAAAIRGRRQERGMSQVDLAEAAGVSRRWLIDLESGKTRVDTALVLRVLDVLGLDLWAGDTPAPVDAGADTVDLGSVLEDYYRGR